METRIMTFNLRYENEIDIVNSWKNRRKFVVDIISEINPEILGTQEALCPQIKYLNSRLLDYNSFIVEHNNENYVKSPIVFYKKSEFELISGQNFPLRELKEDKLKLKTSIKNSKFASLVKLKNYKTGKLFCVINSHFDSKSIENRKLQAEIIYRWISKQKLPIILIGDFNDTPDSIIYKTLQLNTKLKDTWREMKYKEDAESYTFHGFTGIPKRGRLDWIFVDPSIRTVKSEIIKMHSNDIFPSDHFPYVVDLKM